MPFYGYEDALARRVAGSGPATMEGGSGYFARRGSVLDPALFSGINHLREDARRHILNTFFHFMAQSMHSAQLWSMLWIAGSGITTAWNADREAGGAPGDLDVLVGANYDALRNTNPAYQGSGDEAIGHELNQRLHDGLWSSTDHTCLGGSVFELTYFINSGVGNKPDDILNIAPYAAYCLNTDEWTQRPVEVPKDFSEQYFTPADRARVADDQLHAEKIMTDFNGFRALANGADEGSPMHVNLLRQLHDTVRRGAELFSDIHDHRHDAFRPGGKGYFDPANYRWQSGKASGAITLTRKLKQLDEAAHQDIGTGGECTNAEHLILLGALANGGQA